MTQKELLNLDHLKIAEVKPGYFTHVHAEDGFYITDWNKENIKDYSASVCMYLPIRDEYKDYYIITATENAEYQRQLDEYIKKEQEEMEKNRNVVNE